LGGAHDVQRARPPTPTARWTAWYRAKGGFWNAFTWIDFTAYYETMPTSKIDLALQLEADRMANTLMTPEEIESERTVIISERQMYENDPNFQLSEELTSVAFRVHPYHHEVIGDVADLVTMTRDDLYHHYQRHYVPNNAIVVAVGDFATADMMQRIERAVWPFACG
jgi:zinc protease